MDISSIIFWLILLSLFFGSFQISWNTPRRMLQISVVALIASFLSLLLVNHPEWDWAKCLGGAFSTIIVGIVSSSVIIFLVILFSPFKPTHPRGVFLAFFGALSLPMLFISPMLIYYQYITFSEEAKDIRYYERMLRDK